MAIEIRCDVEGCDSLAPASHGVGPFEAPAGWSMLIIRSVGAGTELDLAKRKKLASLAQRRSELAGVLVMPPILGEMELPEIPRKVFCCDKHELPKFKAPPPDQFTMMYNG